MMVQQKLTWHADVYTRREVLFPCATIDFSVGDTVWQGPWFRVCSCSATQHPPWRVSEEAAIGIRGSPQLTK